MGIRILVVDDEPTIRSVIKTVLEDDGHDVTAVGSGEEALALFRGKHFPLVLTDIIMGRMSGLELLAEIRLLEPDAVVVVMTSQATLESATAALRSGAYDFLVKPFDDIATISTVVGHAIEKIELLREKQTMVEKLQKSAQQLEAVNTQLREMAIRDGLTGLFNHQYFRESLEVEIKRSRRRGRIFSLIFMDVDHFKHYNDTNGHQAGDALLKGLTNLVRSMTRADTLFARYGGEEFILLAPEVNSEGATQFAERIRAAVAAHPFEGGETQPLGKITLSLGVATFPADAIDSAGLLAAADQAMYAAKRAGRNRVCCAAGVHEPAR